MNTILDNLIRQVHQKYPRPAQMSNSNCCFTDKDMRELLQKPDEDLGDEDFQALISISGCTGEYQESIYFLPLALRHCFIYGDDSFFACSASIYFISCGERSDLVAVDGFMPGFVDCVSYLIDHFSSSYTVKSVCHDDGDVNKYVDGFDCLRNLLDCLLQYAKHSSLATETILAMASPTAAPHHAALLVSLIYRWRCDYIMFGVRVKRWRDGDRSSALCSNLSSVVPPLMYPEIDDLVFNDELLAALYKRVEESNLITAETRPHWEGLKLDIEKGEVPFIAEE